MPLREPRFNNAAERLHAILEAYRNTSRGQSGAEVWAEVLACNPNDISEIYGRLWELRQEWKHVVSEIQRLKPDARDRTFYEQHFPAIEKAIQPSNVLDSSQAHAQNVTDVVLVVLGFCANELPKETPVTPSEIGQILRQLEELRSAVQQSNDLPASVKTWILDLVRLIRDGIDRYHVRAGQKGYAGPFMRCWENCSTATPKCRNSRRNPPRSGHWWGRYSIQSIGCLPQPRGANSSSIR